MPLNKSIILIRIFIIINRRGHIAANCYNRFNKSFNTQTSQKQFHLALEEDDGKDFSILCYSDSGATTYIISDFGNLSIASKYEGGDQITTANDSSMKILYIGNSSFICNDRLLHIRNLLHVPSTSKNLISIKKICSDNNVAFEFDCAKVLVRDKITNKVLLEGGTKEKLYTIPIQNSGSLVPHYAFIYMRRHVLISGILD